MLSKQEEEEIIEEPMGDDDIRKYFPSAKIMTYSDLNKYDDIEDLLPTDKDYAFVLIEDSPNKGHWVVISKYGDTVEFFDSYGGKPDSQLKWNSKANNAQLGQSRKKLTEMFNKHKGRVVYNPVKYQGGASDVNTCGRHATFRIQNMKDGKDLDTYYKYMSRLKNHSGKDYDEIVASFIQQ
jgi:hypothetical protein